MEWQLTSAKIISHRDGHRIELKSGTWKEPYDVHPIIKKGTPAVEVAKLIREGLESAFAQVEAIKRQPEKVVE